MRRAAELLKKKSVMVLSMAARKSGWSDCFYHYCEDFNDRCAEVMEEECVTREVEQCNDEVEMECINVEKQACTSIVEKVSKYRHGS